MNWIFVIFVVSIHYQYIFFLITLSSIWVNCITPNLELGTLQICGHISVQIFETLNRVDQMCEGLQRAASLLEGRLAELENWSSEAQEVCQLLKERQHRSHWGPHLRTKVSKS